MAANHTASIGPAQAPSADQHVVNHALSNIDQLLTLLTLASISIILLLFFKKTRTRAINFLIASLKFLIILALISSVYYFVFMHAIFPLLANSLSYIGAIIAFYIVVPIMVITSVPLTLFIAASLNIRKDISKYSP
jgi:hypothetical protein